MTAIYGAGWHGKEVFALCNDIHKLWGRVTFIDDAKTGNVCGCPIVGSDVLADRSFLDENEIAVAIGDNQIRQLLSKTILERGGRLLTARHHSATVWTDHPIGIGTIIFPNAIVSIEARIGRFCIINKHATVGHGAELGEAVNMADASVCSGKVGERTFLGFHAAVLPGVDLGSDVTVGAGAVVTRNVENGQTVTGIPARSR